MAETRRGGEVNCYAFDVDHTLWLSEGPILLSQLIALREQGHIVGLCGNWGVVTRSVPRWHLVFSFIGPLISKSEFLQQIKTYVPADNYIMVGNDPRYFGASDDKTAALLADWQFVREVDFAATFPPRKAQHQ